MKFVVLVCFVLAAAAGAFFVLSRPPAATVTAKPPVEAKPDIATVPQAPAVSAEDERVIERVLETQEFSNADVERIFGAPIAAGQKTFYDFELPSNVKSKSKAAITFDYTVYENSTGDFFLARMGGKVVGYAALFRNIPKAISEKLASKKYLLAYERSADFNDIFAGDLMISFRTDGTFTVPNDTSPAVVLVAEPAEAWFASQYEFLAYLFPDGLPCSQDPNAKGSPEESRLGTGVVCDDTGKGGYFLVYAKLYSDLVKADEQSLDTTNSKYDTSYRALYCMLMVLEQAADSTGFFRRPSLQARPAAGR